MGRVHEEASQHGVLAQNGVRRPNPPRTFAKRLGQVVDGQPKAFADALGLSLSTVYNYLNGRIPSALVLLRIASYSGKPMEWFLIEESPETSRRDTA